jgi:hypothetical protein
MLLRRQGRRIQQVEPHFDPRALTEITFRPSGGFSEDAEAFDARMEAGDEHLLESTAHGPVQADAEQALLDGLADRLQQVLAALDPSEVLVIESRPGVDWPKTRERRKDVIVDGENRYHFNWWIEPPLRVVVHRPRGGPAR